MGTPEEPATDGRQLRWQRHKQERRRVILDAAIEVLDAHAPGEEIHVQEIADRAGLSRTVVYRHFDDRSDLDLAVQREICRRIGEAVIPAVRFEGTPVEIIGRIVGAYIRWAADNGALMHFVEQDLAGVKERPIDDEIEQIAVQVRVVMNDVVDLVGADLPDDDRLGLVPWVFGLVGGCFYAVRRWTSQDSLQPDVDAFITLMTQTIWFQVDGLARSRGIELPVGPVESLGAEFGGVEDGEK